jgi:hypothetical protein
MLLQAMYSGRSPRVAFDTALHGVSEFKVSQLMTAVRDPGQVFETNIALEGEIPILLSAQPILMLYMTSP